MQAICSRALAISILYVDMRVNHSSSKDGCGIPQHLLSWEDFQNCSYLSWHGRLLTLLWVAQINVICEIPLTKVCFMAPQWLHSSQSCWLCWMLYCWSTLLWGSSFMASVVHFPPSKISKRVAISFLFLCLHPIVVKPKHPIDCSCSLSGQCDVQISWSVPKHNARATSSFTCTCIGSPYIPSLLLQQP